MRYGILSDIHGNLHALETAVTLLRREGVDAFLCPGDLVGYGPFPNECVERIAELGAVTVAGNHDLIALGRLPDDRCIRLARESLAWTRGTLREDARRYLAGLPLLARVGEALVMAHGSLDDPREYVVTPAQAAAQLARLPESTPEASLLLLGHTHRPMVYARAANPRVRASRPVRLPDEPCLLNAGSVGQSRGLLVRARCMLLDLEAREVRLYAFPFDTAACRRALRKAGLPPRSYHLLPRPLAAGRSVVGRLARAITR